MATLKLPNIGEPRRAKIAVLRGIVQSSIQYGVPVWHKAVKKNTRRRGRRIRKPPGVKEEVRGMTDDWPKLWINGSGRSKVT